VRSRVLTLGAYLDYIIPIRFGVGGANKRATEYSVREPNSVPELSQLFFV